MIASVWQRKRSARRLHALSDEYELFGARICLHIPQPVCKLVGEGVVFKNIRMNNYKCRECDEVVFHWLETRLPPMPILELKVTI